MAVPTLPAPAMATFIPVPATGAAATPISRSWNRWRASVVATRWRMSPSWPTRSAKSRRADPGPGDRHQGDLAGHRQVRQALARPPLGQPPLDQRARRRWDRTTRSRSPTAAAGGGPGRSSTTRWPPWRCRAAGRSGPDGGRRCGPRRWGSSRSPRAMRAVRMLELSPLVTAARADASGGPGLVEVVAVEPRAHHRGAGPVGRQPTERLGIAVDDGDRVALGGEVRSEAGADPSASDDDDVHGHHATRIDTADTTQWGTGSDRRPGGPAGRCGHALMRGWTPTSATGGDPSPRPATPDPAPRPRRTRRPRRPGPPRQRW